MNAFFIDAEKGSFELKDADDFGPVDFGFRNRENFNFGAGRLCPFPIAGPHRLIISGNSEFWDGFYISTLSGAAEQLYYAGIDYVSIKGKATKLKVLKIQNKSCKFFDIDDIKKIFDGYKGKKGARALEQYVFDNFSNNFKGQGFRIMAVGPAALSTNFGAICSTVIEKGKFREGVISWAGRGGFGSLLAQRHNIAAIIFGGNTRKDVWKKDKAEIEKIFQENLGKPMVKAIMDATVKYRYDEGLKSGGTFGANMTTLKGCLLSFNWQSVYKSDEERKKLYDNLVAGHYLKQFNEEIVEPRSFTTCGEHCVAACKKMYKAYKKDYEPYEAAGCNCGIFDQRAAELLVLTIDDMGFDAIEAGNMISFVMELLAKGRIKKEDYGLGTMPKFDDKGFDAVNDSMHNAKLGVEIANLLLNNNVFQHGIREAAKQLKAEDIALYTPHKKGSIAPNQYWVSAFFLPLPIQGKYLSDYGSGFKTPYELGKSSAERMIKELYSDNTGICRFHRGWAEKLAESLVNGLLGMNVNYHEHHKALAKLIYEANKDSSFWESERVVDVIKIHLERLYKGDESNNELKAWVERFNKDKWEAAKAYWHDIIKGFSETL